MKRNILIVGQDGKKKSALTAALQKEYALMFVSDYKSVISCLGDCYRTISALLLLVEKDGEEAYSLLNTIRQDALFSQIPVIVAVDIADKKIWGKALELGANGFVERSMSKEVLLRTVSNAIRLRDAMGAGNTLWQDRLTGLFNREAFFAEAEKLIKQHESGYYVLSCIDVDNFKIINDQYGTQKGDEVLQHVAESLNNFVVEYGGLACRFMADKFGVMYPAKLKDTAATKEVHRRATSPSCINHNIRVHIGRYVVCDLEMSISAMYDRATLAAETIKGRYDTYVTDYDENMRLKLVREQQIVTDMSSALAAKEFEVWFQPQYNHNSGAMIGAEALVRWRKNGKLISPGEFIPVFERNGFIYELDQYVWEQVCARIRGWLDSGKTPLPISVNISRRDLFHQHFIPVLTGIVNKYAIPYDLIRLEVTESAFSEGSGQIIAKVDEMIKLGFTVEIDDFGSGYSSLNTLKDVPASILKLDMKFFENTTNSQRSGNIIESVVRMAKWLGMAVIAEGV